MKKVSKEIEDKIIDLYINQKLSTTIVASIIGITHTGVRKILKRRKIQTRTISESKTGAKKRSKLSVKKIIDLYAIDNKSSIQISKIINCSKTSVLKILKENNVKLKKPGYRGDYEHPKTQEIKNLYLNGLSIKKVANIVNLSYTGTHGILAKLKIIRSDDRGKSSYRTKMTKEHKDKVQKIRNLKKESGEYDHIYLKRTGYIYKEYQEILPEYIKYHKKVRSITNKQPIENLENYNKRGPSGFEGNYHLDHIFSIAEGFRNNIDPEIIGNIINLKMIPWRENLIKNNNCSISKKELLVNYEKSTNI